MPCSPLLFSFLRRYNSICYLYSVHILDFFHKFCTLAAYSVLNSVNQIILQLSVDRHFESHPIQAFIQ